MLRRARFDSNLVRIKRAFDKNEKPAAKALHEAVNAAEHAYSTDYTVVLARRARLSIEIAAKEICNKAKCAADDARRDVCKMAYQVYCQAVEPAYQVRQQAVAKARLAYDEAVDPYRPIKRLLEAEF